LVFGAAEFNAPLGNGYLCFVPLQDLAFSRRTARLALKHQLAAVQRLCDIKGTLNTQTATATTTGQEAPIQ
jgi:hypothetical protein